MPNHDYRCDECGWILADQYRSITEGGQSRLPDCFNCDRPMSWIPQARMSVFSDGTGFAKFSTTDTHGQPVEIDSLRKLRQVERDSEVAARNGEGQQMVFRAFSNTRGNRLDHTLGDIAAPAISAEGKRKFGLQGGASPIAAGPDGAPDIPYGPGVSDANASALKDS